MQTILTMINGITFFIMNCAYDSFLFTQLFYCPGNSMTRSSEIQNRKF